MGIINNLINSIKDNFTMAEFSINGRMTVKSLRKQFKDAFGASLRVYKGAKFAPEDATLASIRSGENVKGGELVCKGNLQVGNFEAATIYFIVPSIVYNYSLLCSVVQQIKKRHSLRSALYFTDIT